MVLSAAERQVTYRKREYAKLEALPKIQCACGCGELIPPINKMGKFATYKHGHNPDGLETRFKEGQVSPNKGKHGLAATWGRKGRCFTKEAAEKRTATRLANNGGVYSNKSGWKQKPLTIALMTKINKEKALCGEDNPAWLGGKSFEKYGIEFNDNLKQSILIRDGCKCTECGESQARLIVHHKDTNKMNNNPTNLQILCNSCHGKLHGKVLQNIKKHREVI